MSAASLGSCRRLAPSARLAAGLLGLVLAAAGCGHSSAERRARALPSITALQKGDFEAAQRQADAVLADDGGNGQAAGVTAIARFRKANHQLVTDLRATFFMLERGRIMDHRYTRFALQTTVEELDLVDRALASAATDPDFGLELCPACWKVDWNGSGGLDDRDEKLFQIELDADGNELPPDDPRRVPTFRLDASDVHWARALVAFERALLELVLAYDWSGLTIDSLRPVFDGSRALRVPLADRARFARVGALLRFALDEAEATRRACLAEADDDREWLPGPRQKSHPLPLPVDDALYDTWAGVIGDLRALLDRREGISVAELAQLGRRQWEHPPGGYLDLGGLLADPRDLVLDLGVLKDKSDRNPEDVETVLSALLGDRFARTMAASKLVSRLLRMRDEVDRGTESFDRKLRYLFWLN